MEYKLESKDGEKMVSERIQHRTDTTATEVEIVSIDHIELAINYCNSHAFKSQISALEISLIDAFQNVAESKEPEKEEQTLQHMISFKQYQDRIDELLSVFVLKHNITTSILFDGLRDAYEGRYLPLFQEEHENKWFVDLLMSWMSYEHFLDRMCCVVNTSNSSSGGRDRK